MPEKIFMQLQTEELGIIPGGIDVTGFEDLIECTYFSHEAAAPSGTQPGEAFGIHESLTIQKHVDKSSPVLYQLLRNGTEAFAEFRFFMRDRGFLRHYFTLRISHARIVSIKQLSALDRSIESATMMIEAIEFDFNDIEMMYEESSATQGSNSTQTGY